MNADIVTFRYNRKHKEWEYEWGGGIYSFDTFIEAATDYNMRRFEA